MSKAIERVISTFGAVQMPADLALLKRELSRCHDALCSLPTESDFLSIAVLVESELGVKHWRDISKDELRALKSAIVVGMKDAPVTFDDYNRALRTLNSSGFMTGPTLELGSVEFEPDEEEPADL